MNLYRLLQKRAGVGRPLTWPDVAAEDSEAVRFRHERDALFGKEAEEATQ